MSEDKSSASGAKELSAVEATKLASNYLRGTIRQELREDSESFDKDNTTLLKFHGTYQQDNRDARAANRSAGGKDKEITMMIRTRIPGGRLTSAQMLAELDLCDEVGNQTLRLTSRQALQHHGVPKKNLWQLIHRINEIKLSTLAACGDVNRNIMCCPAPFKTPLYNELHKITDELTEHLAPKSKGYYEIWVRDINSDDPGELVGGTAESDVIEPIYGKTYLPRKFKTGIALPFDNCIDIYTQDLGFLAVIRDGKIVGYNVLVGGGMGTTPANKKTYPALAKRMAFVTPDQVLLAAECVVKVQRDFGNREDRKVARLKYLVNNWGIEKFKATVDEYAGTKFAACESDDVHGFDDHIGWGEQGDGLQFYGLNIENGRLYDDEKVQIKRAVREICTTLNRPLRLTSHQSLLICDLDQPAKKELMDILRRNNVRTSEQTSTVRRWSMACVAWPTCSLAITESERALPGVIDEMEPILKELGLEEEKFTVRMTGCPNGCARPYNPDIGLVGKAKDRYTVYLGGRLLGNRLGFIYKDLVPRDSIIPLLKPVFVYYKAERNPGESFGDFCFRKGKEDLLAKCDAQPSETAS